MSSSSGGYFHQSCHVTKARVSLNWHQRRQACWVLRRVGWRSACCHQQCAAAVECSPWCISATSVKFPLRKCGSDDAFACQSSALVRNSEVIGWKLETIGVTHPLWKISGYATGQRHLITSCLWVKTGDADPDQSLLNRTVIEHYNVVCSGNGVQIWVGVDYLYLPSGTVDHPIECSSSSCELVEHGDRKIWALNLEALHCTLQMFDWVNEIWRSELPVATARRRTLCRRHPCQCN